jgi:large subunit ribosomal protein L4
LERFMPKIDIYNPDKKKVGEIELADAVFGTEVREHLLYAAVRYQRAKARAGTHKSKQRSDVRGGGRKPWRQKGTGRARQGSIRSPQWRGGGTVFGPVVRSHAMKLNKQVRSAALCSALSRRVAEKAVLVLDDLVLPEIKTRQITEFMKRFELGDMLLVTTSGGPADTNLERSARNLGSVTLIRPEGVNVYDVLLHKNLVLTRSAVEHLTARLGAVTSRLGGAE